MCRILVNAVSAKTGGARTIVESFVSNAAVYTHCEFYVFASFSPSIQPSDNVIWRRTDKSGAQAVLFTFFGVLFPYMMLRCEHLLSFNNINTFLLPSRRKTTYFHQAKALDRNNRELKSLIYRFYLSLTKDSMWVQTPQVLRNIRRFLRSPERSEIVWPGIDRPHYVPINTPRAPTMALVPVSDILAPHKNFEFILEVAAELQGSWEVIVTSSPIEIPSGLPRNIRFIGPVSRENLFVLYHEATCVLFPSRMETVGLPVFEALSSGTSVVAYAAEYITDLKRWFGFESGLAVVETASDAAELIEKIAEMPEPIEYRRDFRVGDWLSSLRSICT